jgi:signal transduction histidine kinase/ActR/RegA family two-component response regulator
MAVPDQATTGPHPPAGDPAARDRLLVASAMAAGRLEREADLHAAAALFLSALRQHYGARRAILTVTDSQGRDQQWFFAGLNNADIDHFHAHRPTAAERDAWFSDRHRVVAAFAVPLAACRARAGLRAAPGQGAGMDAGAEDILVVPFRGAGGEFLGSLVVEDGRDRATREPAMVAALELFAGPMARLLERKRLDHFARNAEMRLRHAQEQLMQADKLSAIGQLISGVAHELNNPLSGVMGFTQLLQASETNPKARQHLERIYNEAVRCQKIVQNLLSFARRHKPEKTPQSLNDVIETVLDLRAYQMQVDDVAIERRYEPSLPATMLDVHQVQQVVLNLVNNAHQAMMANGSRPRRLTVTTEMHDGRLRASVADTGNGIPQDRIHRLFEPFFTTKEPGKGTGLGLSVSLGIIKDHQGTMGVESTVGEGSRFTFELPLVECQHAPAPRPEAAVLARAAQCAPLRILVVDDEPVLTELLSDLLGSVGHDVDHARDGRVALRMALAKPYDVILSDLKMPGLDGQGLYEEVCRQRPEMQGRFIFTTGDVVNPEAQGFLQGSGCSYLSKPFKLEAVLALVDQTARARAA